LSKTISGTRGVADMGCELSCGISAGGRGMRRVIGRKIRVVGSSEVRV
jgi:hypothetical protein